MSRLDRDVLAARLAGFDRREHELGTRKPAAVAVVVVESEQGAGILVTTRSEDLRSHAGQWALPGGRLDHGETPEQAALRELAEELGLTVAPAAVLGRLDDYSTRSGYRLTPVVMWAGAVVDGIVPNPREVASVHVAYEPDLDVRPRFITIPESDAPVIQLPMLDTEIHAPTAAVVYQFRELALHGRTTRVEDLEQPVFAWQ
jgi:8-oxo-dGTP pyrophosphatase MutT (NUDIX family)